ncbi:alpha/beta hydrolase [Bifidobacterium canis]|uniref:Xylan esterase n=1 Tax=Bifidobacterium canis TaxID=2610880 RepID=A0A7K1J755_9BIFI|nr:alpha/beta hydrolase [Bifidobacterium canis]MUH60295.1 xylan esterase [Bifidobacterium canis]
MQYIDTTIPGNNGALARFTGYVPDNSEEIVPDRLRPTVLIIPGGGYSRTSDREAEPIALQFLPADYNAFVLRYSCAPSVYPTALVQVAAAVQMMHDHAREWNIDTNRITILGFSAGGHLAANFATTAGDDAIREQGYDPDALRPNALMLGYPVITAGEFRHDGSFRMLLGDNYLDPTLMHEVSIEEHIDEKTPPVFVWHTMTDDCVPVENTLQLIAACHAANVPIEAHLFPQGGHGLGLGTAMTGWGGTNGIEPAIQSWPTLALDWLSRTFA